MRIVLIVSTFPKVSETFIISKFLGLLDRGLDIHLVYHQSETESWANFLSLQTDLRIKKHIHRTWPTSPKLLSVLLILPALIRGLALAPRAAWNYLVNGFKIFRWDVIKKYYLDLEFVILQPSIIHFEFGALAVGRTYLKDLLGSKLTVSFRGYDLNFSGLDEPDYYSQVWQTVDACHFLGEDLWRRALRRGCPQVMPHQFISPAIDLDVFSLGGVSRSESVGAPNNPLKILSIGRLEWKKGYEFALQAIRLLIDKGISVEYKIIGDGEHRDALYFARHQLALKEIVEFCGSLPHNEVIQQLTQVDIFLHSAVSEGFCNAVLEAQAMGIPVVCTDADGLAENIADGVTGFVVPRRDPQAMVEKLLMLAKDPSLRLSMGTAGRQRIKTKFRLDQQLDAWVSFYQDL